MTDYRELLEHCLIGFLVGALATRALLKWWDKR